MSDHYTEDEAVAAVARLTRTQLLAFVDARIVTPLQTEGGQVFRQVDLVRMELLCELSEDFELNEDALVVVISLIDQLHEARADLRCLAQVIEAEPTEVRARIAEGLRRARSGQ